MLQNFRSMAAVVYGCILLQYTASANDALVQNTTQPPQNSGSAKTPLLTLEAAYAWAEKESPHLKAIRLEAATGAALMKGAGAHPNPDLEIGVEGIRAQPSQNEERIESFTLGLNQAFEWGGKRAARREHASIVAKGHGLDSALKRVEHRLAIAEAVVQISQLQRIHALARERRTLAARLADTAIERAKAGKISPMESTRLGADALLATSEEEEAALELANARAALASFMGTTESAFGEVDFNLERPPFLLSSEGASEPNLAASLAMRKVENDVEGARAELAMETKNAIPDVTLSVGLTVPTSKDRPTWEASLGIPLPLFDRNQGARGTAAIRAESAPLRARAETESLARKKQQLRAELKASMSKASTLKKGALGTLERSQADVEEAYRQGRLGYLDVVASRETLTSLQTKYFEALTRAHVAAFRVAALSASEQNASLPSTPSHPPHVVGTRP